MKNLLIGTSDKGPVIDNHNSTLPSVIVPDIHARWEFVAFVFANFNPSEYNLVFTGDILHSEGHDNKWREIEQDYIRLGHGDFGPYMQEEWDNSLKALELILTQQAKYPDTVHLLRGNHDDISCKLYSDYGKYARRVLESRLFREFGEHNFPEIIEAYYKYEKKIPYLYIGPDFLASHTIPDEKVGLKEIKSDDKRTHWLFSWADNTNYDSGCLRYFDGNMKRLGQNAKYWFCGHRPVKQPDLLRLQCGGRLVQNNNPDRWVLIEKPLEGPYVASLLKG